VNYQALRAPSLFHRGAFIMKVVPNSAAALLLVCSLAPVHAEPMPKPGPEVGKLGYYVGTWQGHGEIKASPLGRGGKLSSRQTCKWFRGGFQVICEGEETGPSGKRGFLNVLAYDREAKAYTEYSVSSRGEAEYDRGGSWRGRDLTFVVNQDAGGKPTKFRYTETHVSPSMYAYRAEVAVGGKPWTAISEGEIRKVK
jgi:hypothetical protein